MRHAIFLYVSHLFCYLTADDGRSLPFLARFATREEINSVIGARTWALSGAELSPPAADKMVAFIEGTAAAITPNLKQIRAVDKAAH